MTHDDPCDNRQVTLLTTAPLKRLSRPEVAPPFRVTDRDDDILKAVADFGYASSEQIARRLNASRRAIRLRLHRLFAHQLVARPKRQHAWLAAGNANLIHALTAKGARHLAERGVAIEHLRCTIHNGHRVSAIHLAHTTETADLIVKLELACEAASIRLMQQHALLPAFPEATRASRFPFRLSATITVRGLPQTLTVTPDRLVSLVYPNELRHNACVEIDRGTEVIRHGPRSLTRSTIAKKLTTYFHAWRQGQHTASWNMQGFRVLFVVPSEKRIAHMLETQRQITDNKAPGLFLYSTPNLIDKHGVLGPCWIAANATGVSLLPPTTPSLHPEAL